MAARRDRVQRVGQQVVQDLLQVALTEAGRDRPGALGRQLDTRSSATGRQATARSRITSLTGISAGSTTALSALATASRPSTSRDSLAISS